MLQPAIKAIRALLKPTPILGAVTTIGVFLVILLNDPTTRHTIYPGDDPGYDIPWIFQMIHTKIPVVFGGSSSFGWGHPGPIHMWIITVGYLIGGYLGTYLLSQAINIALFALAAVGLAKAFRTPVAGYGLALAIALGDRAELINLGSSLSWTESPVLSFAAMLACLTAFIASPKLWDWAAPVTFATALISCSVWVDTAPIVILPLLFSIYWIARDRKTYSKKQKTVIVGISLIILVPLLVRWYLVGLDFPFQYARHILTYRGNNAGGGVGQAFESTLSAYWLGMPNSIALKLCMFGSLMPIPIIIGVRAYRGIASRLLVTTSTVTAFVLLVPSLEESHIASIGSALPKIGLGVFLALLTLTLPRNKHIILAITVALSAATLYMFATSPNNHNRYTRAMGSHEVVGTMINALESDALSRRILDRHQMIVFDIAPSSSIRTKISYMLPLELEMWRRGYTVCKYADDWGLGRGGQSPPLLHCPAGNPPKFKIFFGKIAEANNTQPPVFTMEISEGMHSQTEQVSLMEIPL